MMYLVSFSGMRSYSEVGKFSTLETAVEEAVRATVRYKNTVLSQPDCWVTEEEFYHSEEWLRHSLTYYGYTTVLCVLGQFYIVNVDPVRKRRRP